MEQKTKVIAENGSQNILITRDFELPVGLLFRAYAEAAFIEQWMGTKVIKLESKTHGSYRFETTDPKGVIHGFHGVIHEFIENSSIIRTFEIEHQPFGVQLECYRFTPMTDDTSRLTMHVVYESAEKRDQVLQLPFAWGINMAHNRIFETMGQLK